MLEAKNLITTGKVYQLGRLYETGMPNSGKRHYSLTIPGLATGKPSGGKNQLVNNDEVIGGEGRSGLPKPRSTTSRPARRASRLMPSMT